MPGGLLPCSVDCGSLECLPQRPRVGQTAAAWIDAAGNRSGLTRNLERIVAVEQDRRRTGEPTLLGILLGGDHRQFELNGCEADVIESRPKQECRRLLVRAVRHYQQFHVHRFMLRPVRDAAPALAAYGAQNHAPYRVHRGTAATALVVDRFTGHLMVGMEQGLGEQVADMAAPH